jgi:hypothetical protein
VAAQAQSLENALQKETAAIEFAAVKIAESRCYSTS